MIFEASLQKHKNRFKDVFVRLKKANLKLQPDKYDFSIKISYFGHIVTNGRVKPVPGRVKPV